MHALRNAHHLARWVMLWFALTLGVAIASPWVSPRTMELVCTTGGVMKMVVLSDQGEAVTSLHSSLDCPLCLGLALPPASHWSTAPQPVPLGPTLQPIVARYLPAATGGPLPPRGPPAAV
ncbi:DUF2946 domain-containing protein [Comamonas sp. GB3 AK4-5]|uniref:DUF2946 domain-containing protein n=1 Tax=Comamonas sp. GB3 AK4-5 TaxID=3231487 RepID=UPI00351DEBA0